MSGIRTAVPYVKTLAVVLGITLVCFAFRSRVNPTSVAMVFLLGVVFVASRYDRGPAVFASILGTAIFDFLFVPPYNVFDVHDESYFVTFGVMLVVALTMTRLTATIRDQAREARESETRSGALYALRQDLVEAQDRGSILETAARHAGRVAGGRATVVLADETAGENRVPRWPSDGIFEDIEVRVAAGWAFQHGHAAGSGTQHCTASEALIVPLRASSRILGVMAVRSGTPGLVPTPAVSRTVQALADEAALAYSVRSR